MAGLGLLSLTAKSVDLTRDLGSILRPSQDKLLLVISIIRKRFGLNQIAGNFDGNHPFFLYERPSRAHVVSTREALRPRKPVRGGDAEETPCGAIVARSSAPRCWWHTGRRMQQFGRREMALRQGIDLVCDLAFSSFFTVCCAITISFGPGTDGTAA